MQNSENIPINNIFLNFLSTSMTHLDFLDRQPSDFSKFATSLLQNTQNLQLELQKNFKEKNTNYIIFKSQRGKLHINIKNFIIFIRSQ